VEGEVLLKISLLIYSLASGGAERQVSILLKELSKKYKIYLVLMNDTIFYEIPKNVEVFYLEKSNPFESGIKKLLKIPFLAMKYKKFLKEKEIDVSLSFMNRPNYINVLANRGIVSERINPFEEYKTNSLKDKINRLLVKALYKKAKKVIPNSKGTEIELNKRGIKNTEVIYNMLELKQIDKLRNEEIDLQKEKFTFITIGRLEPQKNTILLIEAIKNIDAKLWIIGDGYLRDSLELKVKNEKLEEKVKFLGRQKNVYKFLNKADCFVFSSNYEGFPNVLLEALACKLPIISIDCKSGPREILAPNSDITKQTKDIEIAEYGILTPVGDVEKMQEAMQMIINDKNLREGYRKKALNRAKDFSIDKIIPKWERILND